MLDWTGMYRNGWKGEIVGDAFVHPAKFSRALIRQIYAHLLAQGYVKPGDTVLDCFGGVALGGLDAMANGLHWVGVELEPRFVDLGNANIDLWNRRYAGKMPQWGTARLIQGDSRRLAEVVTAANIAVTSPPYADGCAHTGGDDLHADRMRGGEYHGVGLHGAVSSPPYSESLSYQRPGAGGKGNELMRAGFTVQEIAAMRKNGDPRVLETRRGNGYSRDMQNLGNLPAGDFHAAISSPPYEGSPLTYEKNGLLEDGERPYKRHYMQGNSENYGGNKDNLVNASDFWHSARSVVEEVYTVLVPGAVSVWVVKDFVRNKQRVEFCRQWQVLCEACGFETVEIARAWLTEDRGTAIDLDGNHHTKTVKRMSFFRRLHVQKYPHLEIPYEEVLFMRKTLTMEGNK